jgi:hypothetical protein
MTESLQCWRCGASLASLSLPLSRQDQCPDCSVYLHNCRMCSFFDPAVVEQCREDDAEEVKNKEGANFCDYFRPNPTAHDARYVSAEGQARSQLESLFDDADAAGSEQGAAEEDRDSDAGNADAEDLFR